MRDIFTINPFFLLMSVRFCILLILAVFFMWLYSVGRLRYSRFEKLSLKQSVNICLIESSIIAILLLVMYFCIFITMNEWQRFVWLEWRWLFFRNIYYLLLPEIIMFFSLNVLFVFGLKKLKNHKLLNL